MWFKPDGTYEGSYFFISSLFRGGSVSGKETGTWRISSKGTVQLVYTDNQQYADGTKEVKTYSTSNDYTFVEEGGKKGIKYLVGFYEKIK